MANFDMLMNVVLRAVCFPIFGCISEAVKLFGVVDHLLGELTVRERECQKHEIYRFPHHMTGFKREIYFCAGQISLEFNSWT